MNQISLSHPHRSKKRKTKTTGYTTNKSAKKREIQWNFSENAFKW